MNAIVFRNDAACHRRARGSDVARSGQGCRDAGGLEINAERRKPFQQLSCVQVAVRRAIGSEALRARIRYAAAALSRGTRVARAGGARANRDAEHRLDASSRCRELRDLRIRFEARAAPGLYESARRMPWLLAIGQMLRAELDGFEQPVSERLALHRVWESPNTKPRLEWGFFLAAIAAVK
jgi:hypothetical protein